MKKIFLIWSMTICISACNREGEVIPSVAQWTSFTISLHAKNTYRNAYTDTDVWMVFKNEKGDSLIRPAFWNGGNRWDVRFAPPDSGAIWTWTSYASSDDEGLAGHTGVLRSVKYTGDNPLIKHGFLTMSAGKRNVVHADGTPFLVVGDTPWSIPFRATTDQVTIYAKDRKQKGFNTALLMSVQPDQYAEGPDKRNTVLGFARGFSDLHQGHLNNLNPDYFTYLDSLVEILVAHEIVPVYQPVFHGFGWKGKTVLGPVADPVEYARYCKYLVARYGSMPALWLVSADGTGRDAGVKPGGEAVEQWDAYGQPTGIHYNPADNYLANWADGDSAKCFHYNKTYQDEPWLDFQWAQTGHDGKHITYKVEQMYENKPVKACLNGEPTYEGMGGGKQGLGWWQGEEAWTQLMHGGTMGVVYGAAGLWQWKITPDEEGWGAWTDQPVSWREGLSLEGSRYPGYISKAFRGFDFADMERRWDLTQDNKPLLAKEGVFYVSYLPTGGEIVIKNVPSNMPCFWFNPKTGDFVREEKTKDDAPFRSPDTNPWVLLIGERTHR